MAKKKRTVHQKFATNRNFARYRLNRVKWILRQIIDEHCITEVEELELENLLNAARSLTRYGDENRGTIDTWQLRTPVAKARYLEWVKEHDG